MFIPKYKCLGIKFLIKTKIITIKIIINYKNLFLLLLILYLFSSHYFLDTFVDYKYFLFSKKYTPYIYIYIQGKSQVSETHSINSSFLLVSLIRSDEMSRYDIITSR